MKLLCPVGTTLIIIPYLNQNSLTKACIDCYNHVRRSRFILSIRAESSTFRYSIGVFIYRNKQTGAKTRWVRYIVVHYRGGLLESVVNVGVPQGAG